MIPLTLFIVTDISLMIQINIQHKKHRVNHGAFMCDIKNFLL